MFAKRRKKSDKWVIDETNSESFLKSQKSSKYTNSMPPTPQAPIDNAAIDSISKSINDLAPIGSAAEPKQRPAPPVSSLPPPNFISTTKVRIKFNLCLL